MKSNILSFSRKNHLIHLGFIVLFHFLISFNLQAKNEKQNIILEEIYIHTDKIIYLPGEDIWFKAYILNSEDHTPFNHSKLLYLNIINKKGNPIFSSIYPIKNGLANGDYQLAANLTNGDYYIIAYTENQKKLNSSYWYKKEIIVNSRPVNLWSVFF